LKTYEYIKEEGESSFRHRQKGKGRPYSSFVWCRLFYLIVQGTCSRPNSFRRREEEESDSFVRKSIRVAKGRESDRGGEKSSRVDQCRREGGKKERVTISHFPSEEGDRGYPHLKVGGERRRGEVLVGEGEGGRGDRAIV